MIPTLRMIGLGAVPVLIVLIGGGTATAVALGWTAVAVAMGAFVFDGVLAGRRPRLRFDRQNPLQLHVDQRQRITWWVENRSPFAVSLQLADAAPPGASAEPLTSLVNVAARTRAAVTYDLVPHQRGPTGFGDLTYRVRGPLGLAWRQKRWPAAAALRCLPHLANWTVAELAERRALMRQGGSHRYRWRGAGTIFESLREYSTQDDIRWVDWKATARQGRPISRNFEVDRHQQVILLVDASRAMTTYCGRRTKFDAVLEAAILLTRAVLDQGDALGLVVFADQIDAYLAPRRERTQMTAVMEHLYAKQPRLVEPNFEAALTRATHSVRRSLIILLTDVTVIEAARRMLGYLCTLIPRHLPLVVTIADEVLEKWETHEPQTTQDFYRVGVANDLMLERAVLLEELRRSGADVLDSPADQVAPRAIERYLDLKRRLRL